MMAEKIKITFLGTGSAIPTARRNHPAVLLQFKDENILIDCGEGTQRQFRKAKINPCKITKILISHWHGDHTLGIPGLLQTLVLNGYNRKLKIYGPRGTKKKIKEIMDVFMRSYLKSGKGGGQKLDLEVYEVGERTFFESEEYYLESASLNHGVPAVAYAFVVREKKRLDKKKLKKLNLPKSSLIGELVKGKVVEINGKKINGKKISYLEPSRRVSIVMDTLPCNGAVEISRNANVLVCESSFSVEDKDTAKNYGHLTSVDAAKIAKKAGAMKLFLVHLSQRYDAVPKIILNEANKIFKDVKVAEDLDRVEL
jgi:ribonuclease Z